MLRSRCMRPILTLSLNTFDSGTRDSQASAQPFGMQAFNIQSYNPDKSTAATEKLRKMPATREPAFRRPGYHLNLDRPVSFEAAMAQVVGTEPPEPCRRCANGCGPFTTCVTVDNYLLGSCANCQYLCKGVQCSFRSEYGLASTSGLTNVNSRCNCHQSPEY